MFVYKGHCLAIRVGIQVNNLFYYTTSIRVVQGAKYEIPQTRSIQATITAKTCQYSWQVLGNNAVLKK